MAIDPIRAGRREPVVIVHPEAPLDPRETFLPLFSLGGVGTIEEALCRREIPVLGEGIGRRRKKLGVLGKERGSLFGSDRLGQEEKFRRKKARILKRVAEDVQTLRALGGCEAFPVVQIGPAERGPCRVGAPSAASRSGTAQDSRLAGPGSFDCPAA